VEPLLGATGAEPHGQSRAGVTARNDGQVVNAERQEVREPHLGARDLDAATAARTGDDRRAEP
jgi:hypothetical protein